MAWKNSTQLIAWLVSEYDRSLRENMYSFFAVHSFLHGAIPKKDETIESQFENTIVVSEYGKGVLSRIDTSSCDQRTIAMACAILFFHHDFLIDVRNSDPDGSLSLLGDEFMRGRLHLPQRLGRELYDKFNAMPDKGRIEYLPADDVDALLEGTQQGVYQIGSFVSGPFGIFRSEEDRFFPPVPKVPLWHCADPGCQQLHSVNLLRHKHSAYVLAKKIAEVTHEMEGAASEWDTVFRRMGRRPSTGKDYFDLSILLAEGLSGAERLDLVACALRGTSAEHLQEKLKRSNLGANRHSGDPRKIAEQLSESEALQLLMTLTDSELVRLVDNAALERRIKIPATESRAAKAKAPKVSSLDLRSTLSALGVRSDREHPLLFLSATIWTEYEKAGQLSELAWRCHTGSAMPRPGLPIEYMKTHTAREAVRNLILPSKPITLAIASKLQLELIYYEPDDQTIDRFLWSFGLASQGTTGSINDYAFNCSR